MRLYAWLVGAWTAVLWFFTFGVARMLFYAFPRERAGEVTTALFPAYFGVTIALGLACVAALGPHLRRGWRKRTGWTLQLIAVLSLAAIPLLIQPAIAPHAPGTPGFARLHGISMTLNLLALLLAPLGGWLALHLHESETQGHVP